MGLGGWHGRMRAWLRRCNSVIQVTALLAGNSALVGSRRLHAGSVGSKGLKSPFAAKDPYGHLGSPCSSLSLPRSTLVLEEEEEARQREAARIRRGMFTKSFGRKPDKPLWTPEQMEAEARKRRVVTEKAPAGGGRK